MTAAASKSNSLSHYFHADPDGFLYCIIVSFHGVNLEKDFALHGKRNDILSNKKQREAFPKGSASLCFCCTGFCFACRQLAEIGRHGNIRNKGTAETYGIEIKVLTKCVPKSCNNSYIMDEILRPSSAALASYSSRNSPKYFCSPRLRAIAASPIVL